MSSHVMNELNRMYEVMLSNPQVPELFGKLESAAELSATENALLDIVARRYLVHWWEIQTAFDRKLVDKVVFETFYHDVKRIAQLYPPLRAKMNEIMHTYPLVREIKILAPLFEELDDAA